VFSPALHLVQRWLVGCVTLRDDFFEVAVLCLDDLVGGCSVMCDVAVAAQLLACHRLHVVRSSLGFRWSRAERSQLEQRVDAPLAGVRCALDAVQTESTCSRGASKDPLDTDLKLAWC
jgi:hypothetical protein